MKEMLSVVIPVYNEAGNIRRVLDNIRDNSGNIKLKIYIIYDSAEDDTLPVIAKIRKRYPFPIALVKNAYGHGALNAIRMGFAKAVGDAVLVTTSDLSDDASDIPKMFALIGKGCDLVAASRHMIGGRYLCRDTLKRALSRFIGVSLHHLTGIPTMDAPNGFKMYRRSMLDKIEIESTGGFEVSMELAVKAYAKGFRIAEIPTIWKDRLSGKSKFHLTEWAPGYLRWYIYALTHRP